MRQKDQNLGIQTKCKQNKKKLTDEHLEKQNGKPFTGINRVMKHSTISNL